MNFNVFLNFIPKIKNAPLPGEESHLKMIPPFRKQLEKQQKKTNKRKKKAAVLALFYPDKKHKTKFILILRKAYKGVHSAQVSFPGGKLEKQDRSIKEAAIRETFEEVGVDIKDIDVVKSLTKIYIPPSNFLVQPFIGITKKTPRFVKQDSEIEELIEVDLKYFLDNKRIVSTVVKTSYNIEAEVSAFKLNNHLVWGATAMILSEIKDLLKKMM